MSLTSRLAFDLISEGKKEVAEFAIFYTTVRFDYVVMCCMVADVVLPNRHYFSLEASR
jgi:hypothetical protein